MKAKARTDGNNRERLGRIPKKHNKAMSTCKTCLHWRNAQRELNYWDSTGVCVCPAMKFGIETGRMLGVIDRCNEKDRSQVTGNPSHDIETVGAGHRISESRYSIATAEDFGCILHEPKKKNR